MYTKCTVWYNCFPGQFPYSSRPVALQHLPKVVLCETLPHSIQPSHSLYTLHSPMMAIPVQVTLVILIGPLQQYISSFPSHNRGIHRGPTSARGIILKLKQYTVTQAANYSVERCGQMTYTFWVIPFLLEVSLCLREEDLYWREEMEKAGACDRFSLQIRQEHTRGSTLQRNFR